jgi:hypothetical protein
LWLVKTAGLEALTGTLYKVCGNLIVRNERGKESTALQLKQSHSEQFKSSLKGYVKAYNKEYGTTLSVAFPTPFTITIRERRKSARSAS